jgi:CRP/FNR family cyclic AMP-dependent transcriptional regulator
MASTLELEVRDDCTACAVANPSSFCNLSAPSLAALNAVKFTGIYPKASLLLVEGEMPRGVFILCSGRVKVTTSSAEGKTLIMRIALPGEILGISGTILGKPFEVSAETLEASQLNFIKRDDFLRLMHGHPDVCVQAVKQLAAKYYGAQSEIRALGLSHNTAEKLARLFLGWCTSSGTETPGGVRLRVLFTHEEIAQMIGSTRETVTRVLAEFRHSNVITETMGNGVIVIDRAALKSMIDHHPPMGVASPLARSSFLSRDVPPAYPF